MVFTMLIANLDLIFGKLLKKDGSSCKIQDLNSNGEESLLNGIKLYYESA